MIEKTRDEKEIFSELADLCKSAGYVHAIAYFCFRDNTIKHSGEVKTEDVLEQFSIDRLVRIEISTLIGLACKTDIDTSLPKPKIIQEYIDKTESLLQEIHHSMMSPFEEMFNLDEMRNSNFNPFESGSVLRESIFYGGESAYHFQYRDLSKIKYQKDNDWLVSNKGYSIDQAINVIESIQILQIETINEVMNGFDINHPEEFSILKGYIFSAKDVAAKSGIDLEVTVNVIESFITTGGMEEFEHLDDFNPKNAFPIIGLDEGRYLLFQNYSLVQALYETPFFWFNADAAYKNQAMKHRGEFTEQFSAERLKVVFGKNNVFQNINIVDSKNNNVGEIDVLVIFANRAIVLQAKAKKLTIEARKGNDLSLQDDFKKAVQDSYDQAYSCSLYLTNINYKLIDENDEELSIGRSYKEIYPFCVVSDHYPALSFQARQFLKTQESENILPPIVMDVFFLDVLTEMLQTPLHFLSYINRRTLYGEKILSTHELTILSYHLKQNLYMDESYSMFHLGDDICADLDLAMLTRRDGISGKDTPEGLLTNFKNTTYNALLEQIEKEENPATIDLGFMFLFMSGRTIEQLNDGIEEISKRSLQDGRPHDLTIGMKDGKTGLTVHSNAAPINIAGPKLEEHVATRKYTEKAKEWYGICIDPKTKKMKFGIELDYDWEHSKEMDELVKDLPKPQKKLNFKTVVKGKKTGRNEKCTCGSGIKYKKCHGR